MTTTSPPATPAERLRGRVVLLVIAGILALTAGLYALVGYLLVTKDASAVPDALWLAAGALAGSLTTLLANSKSDSNTATVDVAAPAELTPGDDGLV